MGVNRIDNFNFITLERVDGGGSLPELLRQDKDIYQRAGVNGTAVSNLGVKGRQFQMRSLVDMPTKYEAEDLRFLYAALQSASRKVNLVHNDIDYASFHDVRYIVEDVSQVFINRMGAAVGGLSTPSNYTVRATWTLIPVHA